MRFRLWPIVLILAGVLFLMFGRESALTPRSTNPEGRQEQDSDGSLNATAVSFDQKAAVPGLPMEPDLILPQLDHRVLLEKAEKLEKQGRYLFATARETNIAPHRGGQWRTSGNRARWEYHLRSMGAESLNLGFSEFRLPAGGSLTISDPTGQSEPVRFTDRDNDLHGELWTPVFETEELLVLLDVPLALVGQTRLRLTKTNHGFRTKSSKKIRKAIGDSTSGSCNIDVACSAVDDNAFGPLVDLYRDQIRSVAAYTLGGIETCSGALINNAHNDLTPYFLTADHCGINSSNAASIVVYWNFENSTCRTPNTSTSGANGDGPINQFNTSSVFRAARAASDFCLIELDDPIEPAVDPFFAGWDRSGVNPSTVVGIHHPGVSEKRISFDLDATLTTAYYGSSSDPAATHVRVSDWDFGTTEGGSSGSPLFDDAGRIIGQLHGGDAACGNDLPDWYGRVSRSWSDGGTPSTQLSSWLDPGGTGVTAIDGTNSEELLVVGDAVVTEGDSGTTTVEVTVTLSQATEEEVSVTLRSQQESADGDDFLAVDQQITFAPNQTVQTVSVAVFGDDLAEENETFLLLLSEPSNAAASSQPGRVTILNDDFIAPSINSALTDVAFVGSNFEYRITALNTPQSFSIANGPSGMTVDSLSGVITWTPSMIGPETVTLIATNSAGADSETLTLTVNANSLVNALDISQTVSLSNGSPGWHSRQVKA